MLTLTFLAKTVIDLYVMVLLLRIWMQWVHSDFYNPFSQFVVKITQPIVGPLRRIIPSLGPIDSASLLVAFLLMTIKFPLLLLIGSGSISLSPYNLLFGVIALVKAAGYLIFWIMIIRALMSWVSQGRSPMDYLLHQLTEPLMAPIRRILPAMGGIDFSAMIVILILYLINFLGMDLLGELWVML
ncbi:YggT family protein [Yersinia mollaretii]|uniref:YggT family protein n=1 Tax=Yersinia mollaretii TaxID=33060 RepID=A0AA44CMF4_YERMO|nr:YggT family protein [Yersinia mollaretii]NIL23440.1 YggT family protein [Yersinia mollaretii]CNJ35714.1 integral membrane protein YggT%2C involved in response to extracytoplasmic stress (osmotic shock) [Yersinia mollaretii]CNK39054.1 integral membrane protein YggT%2C involved in response to extracytoplasmic stress (osmotic shock) [Yersinia enterocolitica]CQR16952.1 integral membrane protein YggT%2C involved in response to extracytoplasmic stress (osmotic shock) [Yersinia mollaretii]